MKKILILVLLCKTSFSLTTLTGKNGVNNFSLNFGHNQKLEMNYELVSGDLPVSDCTPGTNDDTCSINITNNGTYNFQFKATDSLGSENIKDFRFLKSAFRNDFNTNPGCISGSNSVLSNESWNIIWVDDPASNVSCYISSDYGESSLLIHNPAGGSLGNFFGLSYVETESKDSFSVSLRTNASTTCYVRFYTDGGEISNISGVVDSSSFKTLGGSIPGGTDFLRLSCQSDLVYINWFLFD